MFGGQLFGAKVGEMMLIGALTAPIESVIVAANVPVLGPALSAYPSLAALSAYVPSTALLPQDVTLQGYEDVAIEHGQGQY